MAALFALIIIFLIFGLLSRSGIQVFNFIPILIILFLLIWLVGYFFVPIALILFVWYFIKKLSGGNNTHKTYYYYDNTNANKAFEEFFRANFGNGYSQQNNNYNNYQNTYFEDKSKYYRILKVRENATQDEIKRAYRNLVKEHHPDKFTNSPDKAYHEEKLKEINEAYEKLSKGA